VGQASGRGKTNTYARLLAAKLYDRKTPITAPIF